MKWTRHKPKVDGLYWWRKNMRKPAEVVKLWEYEPCPAWRYVERHGVFALSSEKDIDNIGGLWGSKIKEPK